MCPVICPESNDSWISILSKLWDDPKLIAKKKEEAKLYLDALENHIKSEYDKFIDYCNPELINKN